jgi:thiamine-monophosphate kinase
MTAPGNPQAGDGEFSLIRRHFASGYPRSIHTALGIGDDASVVTPAAGMALAQSLDTQVADVHFPASAPAWLIAQRALRCAASDLAAMGASPQGFFLGLTLPRNDPQWLAGFASGLRACAHETGLALLGGDTTRGPVCVISIAVQGWLPIGENGSVQGLYRHGAQAGDDIWVSGTLGTAALALPLVLDDPTCYHGMAQSYYFPQPRLALGIGLRSLASAAMDISDGLLQDAGHIALASHLDLHIDTALVPTANPATGSPDWLTCLNGGDDYELLFCASASQREAIQQLASQLDIHCTRIGHCQSVELSGEDHAEHTAEYVTNGRVIATLNGAPLKVSEQGYRHFT